MERTGRTVFITGCSTGIGRAAAALFSERGYQVVATARNPEMLNDLVAKAEKNGQTLIAVGCNVADEASCVAALMAAHEAFGDIHILINNAGYGLAGPIEGVPLDKARELFEVNTFGAMRMVQMIVPDMRRAGWGRIVNVSSILGIMAAPFNGWYSATKFALEGLTETLRYELTRFGIETVSILPGPVKTEFVRNVAIAPLLPTAERHYRAILDKMAASRTGRRKYEVSAQHVARIILKAVEATHSRPRYYITFPAHFGAWATRLLSDRMVERLMRKFYGMRNAEAAASKVGQ